jgi:hypothetical protein
MSSRIYLASQTNRDPNGCNFELLSAAVVIYDGHLPLGNLCQECLLEGPGKAALKVRERAKKLLGLDSKPNNDDVLREKAKDAISKTT